MAAAVVIGNSEKWRFMSSGGEMQIDFKSFICIRIPFPEKQSPNVFDRKMNWIVGWGLSGNLFCL